MKRHLLIDLNTPGWSEREVGHNFSGPSLIHTPPWLSSAPGQYLLYFAHHQGQTIRLAYADRLQGPWAIHPPGTLRLEQTRFDRHIASPDVHVDDDNRRLVMYYHGCCPQDPAIPWEQVTCVAYSADGLNWASDDTALCQSYLRAFSWRGRRYGIAMPGEFYRMTEGWVGLEPRPVRIAGALCGVDDSRVGPNRKPRHFATRVRGDVLDLYFSRAGDTPECILRSRVALLDDWADWSPSEPERVVTAEHDWEGADRPVETSKGGAVHERVHQLRDPAIFHEAGRSYLLYSVAGESGIAMTELD